MSKALKQIFEEIKPAKVSKVYVELCTHFPLMPVQTDVQMRQANKMIDRLVDYLNNEPNESEAAEVSKYLAVLSDLVSAYESKKFQFEKAESRDVLAYLMEVNQLKQSDLEDEIGSQSVVSDVLSGKRNLNVGHIRKLAARFKVSPALFIG
ncbi:MAG: helix-turn-helix domain-containing protein [Bdellovibrionales bacterium]|nr:helix-turn-helix domain-containing protein [Bdellovibrionales bacterium]